MYDLAIIGGGPGGYVAAERAGAAGLSVVLFEKNELGGVCLNEGCIPTKTLLYSAKLFDYAAHGGKYGVETADASFDYGRILERKKKVVRKLVGGVKLKMKNAGVEVVKASARIEGRCDEGFVIRAEENEYIAAKLIISTGSEAVVPPFPGLSDLAPKLLPGSLSLAGTAANSSECCGSPAGTAANSSESCGSPAGTAGNSSECCGSLAGTAANSSEGFGSLAGTAANSEELIMTNREILAMDHRPESLIIIGGGVIGMEFASFFNSLGTKVAIIEMMPKILGPMDGEISDMLQKIYTKKGVDFRLGCKVTALEKSSCGSDPAAGVAVVYEDVQGNVCRAEAEKVLLSIGRRANLKGYGLESLDVDCGRGINVDSHMRTNVPGVYAVGDVTGFSMLAHTASREAEVAVNDILGIDDCMEYNAIPGVVYTNPEVAGVGLTEQEAVDKGIDCEIKKLPMAYSGRFVAENEGGEGICKIIVDKASGKIIGLHMLGNPCSEIIQSACIAITTGMTLEQFHKVVFPHPTVSEIIKETILG